jgi:hypothetical protein
LRNKIDMSLPPNETFLNPWQDGGFTLLSEAEFVWRAVPSAVIEGFAASAHEQINAKITSFISAIRRDRRLSTAFCFEAVLAMLEPASFRKSVVLADDRLLLVGEAGTRAINQYRKENLDVGIDIDEGIAAYLVTCQKTNCNHAIPLHSGLLNPQTPFVIECRNTFNYYHFVTESLCQLTLLDGVAFEGDIYFHFPNHEDKHRPFVRTFVEALFPEFEGRVHYERAPKDYTQALTGYDLLSTYPFAPEEVFAGLKNVVGDGILDEGINSDIANWRIIGSNGYGSQLLALRERALELVKNQDYSHLPKRFYVGRDDRLSRARHMRGEDLLFEHLQLFGFEYVVFENLSPLEQIALMAQAEVMVSYHGAGFTNMLFANPDAYVIELGTLQTAQYRWEDFWPVAHASQCQYVNFFCDFDAVDPLIEPDFQVDGIVPVAISARAVAQVMAFLVTILGHTPELKSPSRVTELVGQLIAVNEWEKAAALLDQSKDLMPGHLDFCLMAADCHKKFDQPKQELIALDMAYKADRSRWQTLVRIIWCANRCERPQVIRWALSRLELDFPDRYAVFLGNHEWVRFVA